jgi:hypothetical protein
MNCELFQDWMQQRFDGQDLVEAPEMERHLLDCPHCAARHEASRRLRAGLRLVTPPCPPPGFMHRLVAAVLADQRGQRTRRRVRIAVCALAASLLLGLGVAGMYRSGWLSSAKQSQQPPEVVDNHLPVPSDEPKSNPPASVRDSVTDAGNALASLTTRTADETMGQTRLLVPMVTGPSLDELDMPPALEPTKSYLETGQGVTVALEPVTNSAQRAINLFRRDLPHVERTMQPEEAP